MTVEIIDDTSNALSMGGVPQTLRQFLSRDRLLTTLDDAASGRLLVVRGPGGAGKTTLLTDWLRRRGDDGRTVVWVGLDESSRSRAGFWHRVVQALVTSAAVPEDGPLSDALSGFVDLPRVPALVLAELAKTQQPIRLVLDDFHVADDDSVNDVIWLLERSHRLQLLVTTRRRLALEQPRNLARLEPTVITGAQLAFDLAETMAVLDRASAPLTAEDAAVIHKATGGHPLATRVTAAAVLQEQDGSPLKVIDRSTIAAHTAEDLLPFFRDDEHRHVALRVALAPSVDLRLAAELSGRTDVEGVLRNFELDGVGEFQKRRQGMVFAFHSLVGGALEWEAEHTLTSGELVDLRRSAARHHAATGNPLTALRLYARAGDHRAMWPVIAQNFSDLINHHRHDLKDIIESVPPHALDEEGTLAISLAVVLSEDEPLPSERLHQLTGTALEQLARRQDDDPVDLFWTLLARFAGLRASRRYLEAAHAGEEVHAHLERLSAEDRAKLRGAIGAGSIQIVITNVLLGRLEHAITLAHRLSNDPHPGRGQHRLSLLSYIQSMRGEMGEAEEFSGAITQAQVAIWQATVPATGWHVAEAFSRLERNDPKGALNVISALDSRLPRLEHWPYVLWTKGLSRLAGQAPELGIDELDAAIRANRSRAASPFALDLLGALRSDLYLAAGSRERALKALDTRSPEATPVVLARARLQLAAGRSDEVAEAVAPLLWGDRSTPRQQVEAFLLHAVSEWQLGVPEEAALSAQRAFRMLEQHRLRMPLIMVPRLPLHELLTSQLPEYLTLLDGLPDPFGTALAPASLTEREREVLMELTSVADIETIAQRLYISTNTVKTHLRNIYRKLGASSRADAIGIARRQGLLHD